MLDQRHQEGELGQQTQAQLATSAPAASVAGSRTLPPSIVDDGDEDEDDDPFDMGNPNLVDSLKVAGEHGFFFKSGQLPTGDQIKK